MRASLELIISSMIFSVSVWTGMLILGLFFPTYGSFVLGGAAFGGGYGSAVSSKLILRVIGALIFGTIGFLAGWFMEFPLQALRESQPVVWLLVGILFSSLYGVLHGIVRSNFSHSE